MFLHRIYNISLFQLFYYCSNADLTFHIDHISELSSQLDSRIITYIRKREPPEQDIFQQLTHSGEIVYLLIEVIKEGVRLRQYLLDRSKSNLQYCDSSQ